MSTASILRAAVLACGLAPFWTHAQSSTPGNVDTSFNASSGPDRDVVAIVVQSSGKVVIGGYFFTVNFNYAPGLARLDVNGTFDSTFVGLGAPFSVTRVRHILPLSGDRLLVEGVFYGVINGTGFTNLVILEADGQLDTNFVSAVTHFPSTGFGNIPDGNLAVQADGKILTASPSSNGVTRLNSHGAVEAEFPVSALSFVALIGSHTNGSLYAGGSLAGAVSNSTLVRLLTNGTADAAFHQPTFTYTNGRATLLSTMFLLPDDRLLVGGQFSHVDGIPRGGIVRLKADGTVDPSFVPGPGGIGGETLPNNFVNVRHILRQSTGRFLLGAPNMLKYGGTPAVGLARIFPDGALDPSFSTGLGPRIAAIPFGIYAAALAPDEKVLVGGTFTNFNGKVARYVARLHGTGAASARPTIVTPPASRSVTSGAEVTFTVDAVGAVPFKYQWKHNGMNVPGATNSALTLTNVQFADVGAYTVTVMNFAGSATSLPAILTVDGVSIPDLTRPGFGITSPRGLFVRWPTNHIAVQGMARDNLGIAAVCYQQETNPWVRIPLATNWSVDIDLQPGTNRFRVKATDTFGNNSPTQSLVIFYVVSNALTLKSSGAGVLMGATNGQNLEIGRGYTLKATPGPGHLFSNWLAGGMIDTNPTLKFLMSSNLQVCANFATNPFLALKGLYSGLFYPMTGEPSHDTCGFFTLTLNDKGAFTGKLLLAGGMHPLSGQFDLALHTRKTVARGTNTPLTVDLQLIGGSDQISGSVSNAEWLTDLFGYRATFSATANPATPFAGRYTMLLSGGTNAAESPFGQGAATLTVNQAGSVMIKGTLADNVTALQTAPVAANGQVPFYVNLYGGKGSIFGWLTFTNTPTNCVDGRFLWTKKGGRGSFYSAGFTNDVNTLGSYYTNRPAGTSIVALSNAIVRLAEGNLAAPLTNEVVLTALNKITVTSTNTNKLALTLTIATGQFNGSFINPDTRKPSLIKGVLLQKQEVGGGFFLGTNQSGAVYLGPAENFPLLPPSP